MYVTKTPRQALLNLLGKKPVSDSDSDRGKHLVIIMLHLIFFKDPLKQQELS